VFQLFSHKNLYDNSDIQQSVAAKKPTPTPSLPPEASLDPEANPAPEANLVPEANPVPEANLVPEAKDTTDTKNAQAQGDIRSVEAGLTEAEEDDEAPQMGIRTTIVLLVIVTVVC